MPYVYSRLYVYHFWQFFQALHLFPALRLFLRLEYVVFESKNLLSAVNNSSYSRTKIRHTVYGLIIFVCLFVCLDEWIQRSWNAKEKRQKRNSIPEREDQGMALIRNGLKERAKAEWLMRNISAFWNPKRVRFQKFTQILFGWHLQQTGMTSKL